MKQLLRADFYRLLRSKFFYILLAVAFGLSLISFLLYLAIARLAEEDLFALLLTAEDLQVLSFDGTVGYCAAIAAAIFICGDYSGGGMRNKIVAGCGRRKIFYSKLIVCSVVSVAVYLAMQVVVFAFGGAAFGLIGRRLGHSWSPTIHELLGSAPYALLELELDTIPVELEARGACRLEAVHQIVDVLSFHTHGSSFTGVARARAPWQKRTCAGPRRRWRRCVFKRCPEGIRLGT